jgi:hypothetical protein
MIENLGTLVETKEDVDKEFNWEDNVKSEITALLDRLLPASVNGVIKLKYRDLVLIETEAGPEYDTTKVAGVDVFISLDFAAPVDKNKIIS